MSEYDKGSVKVQQFNNGQHWERYGFSSGFAEEKKHQVENKDYGYEYSLSINLYRDPNNFTEIAAPGDDDFIDHRQAIINYLLCDELEKSDDVQAKLQRGHDIFTSISHMELTSKGYYSEAFARKQNNRRKHSGQIFITLRPQVSVKKLRAFIDNLQQFLQQLGIDRAPDCLDTEFAVAGAPNISMQLTAIGGEQLATDEIKNQHIMEAMKSVVRDSNMYALFAEDGTGEVREQEFDAVHQLMDYGFKQVAGKRKPTAKQVAWCQACQAMVRTCRHLQQQPELYGNAQAQMPNEEVNITDVLAEFFKRASKCQQRGDEVIEGILEALVLEMPLLESFGQFLYAREERYLTLLSCKSKISTQRAEGYDKVSYEMLQTLSRELVIDD
ncbi:MAG: hypothetical protein P1U40_02745 [Coxiellaceae bacterium]|nr:hypothetical protein [Coxiellaceae bacterium]